MIPNTVSFRFIDKNGGTKRFYRQVFVEPVKVPHKPTAHDSIESNDALMFKGSGLDYQPRSPSAPQPSRFSKYSYLVKLDDRAVILKGLPVLIDHYDLAIMIASEFEAQGEYIRLESMPIADIAINLIERDCRTNAISMDMRRKGYAQSVFSHFESDLLLIAENQRFYDMGFYDREWVPIINWFNETFETDLKLQYMIMKGEMDKVDELETAMDVQKIFDMDPDEVLDKYQETEIAKTIETLQDNIKERAERRKEKNQGPNFGQLKKFLYHLDDTRLWMLDDMIQYCYSPMIAIALLTNAVSLEKILKAVQCPELDVAMIVPNEEYLKLNQTQLKIAACKCFIDVYDKMYPMKNPFLPRYEEPVIV
eukprot:CAMPEP_0202693780 /NCGR_PEP_ID=MMETSP1385-20130828/7811_1 /ASSEMBLY_ACC=CAM_ASM_000861 /TAXON_ID=933848 /ORGANISM="Elphidium margaritaceum" /LENGTH=365 /DNA_ID=CAMNT_0049349511 /DNA_START=104 /DNA_END=1201 /DNA_ORIENTATION=-